MTQHPKLLADYAETCSEEAFRELVTAYIGLVHASATEAVGVFVGVNLGLSEEANTAELFAWLDKHSPDLAERVAPLAERGLIGTKEYKLLGRYIKPDNSFTHIRDVNVRTKELAKKSAAVAANGRLEESASKIFANQSATLVAVLALNDRKEDADRIAAKAAKELNDPDSQNQLADAERCSTGTLAEIS